MPEHTGYGLGGTQKVYKDRHPVQNHEGSSKRPKCGCGSWLNHWKIYTGNEKRDPACFYMGCSKPGKHGAHVRFVKIDKTKKNKKGEFIPKPYGQSFIIPMCEKHNNPQFKAAFFIAKDRWAVDDKAREECKTATYRLNRQNYFRMKVISLSGKPKCGCPSYFQHYRNVSGSGRQRCVAMECGKSASLAVAMRSTDGRTDYDKWMAPVCRGHARAGKEIYIKRHADVVTPKKTDDCGKGK